MKVFSIFLFFISLTSFSLASHWQDAWIQAVDLCQQKNWAAAEKSFTKAISLQVKEGDLEHPHTYVDRARLYLLQNKNAEALRDLDVAMQSPYLIGKDKLRAVVSRLSALAALELEDRVSEDLRLFSELTRDIQPQIDMTDDSIIIRNMDSECECYVGIMTQFFLHAGIVSSKDDIQVLDSGICIAKRAKKKCCCSHKCGDDDPIANKEECKGWCHKGHIVANAWCGKAFKSFYCKCGCLLVIDKIVSWCNWCCDGEKGFYERCIAPFDHLVDYLPQMPCDPAWD